MGCKEGLQGHVLGLLGPPFGRPLFGFPLSTPLVSAPVDKPRSSGQIINEGVGVVLTPGGQTHFKAIFELIRMAPT